jgi:glycosyltransferase involved in cell wall biosynthesis
LARTGRCSTSAPVALVTGRPPVVLLLMRAESPAYHSIERLFGTLAPRLAGNFEVRLVRMPCQSRGILRCARNLIFTARQRADIIHVTGDIHYCAMAIRRAKCVLTIHDLCSLNRLKGARKLILSTFWYSLPLRWAPHVTVISEETKKQLKCYFPAAADKIEVIPNCVDPAFGNNYRNARAGVGELQVLQVGTGWNKNLERVAEAASGLPVRLRIIGPLSKRQRSLLRSLDLNWTSAQQLSGEEVITEYRESHLLVFASTYEGFGLPIAEAQATGLPVITSNMAPMTEVAGDAALFVDPYEEKEIRAALEQLLRSPDLARQLSEQGRRNAERFDAQIVADRYADVYTRVYQHTAPRSRRAARRAKFPGRDKYNDPVPGHDYNFSRIPGPRSWRVLRWFGEIMRRDDRPLLAPEYAYLSNGRGSRLEDAAGAPTLGRRPARWASRRQVHPPRNFFPWAQNGGQLRLCVPRVGV